MVAIKKQGTKAKNFWEEPLFYLIIGAGLLGYSGEILSSLGMNISDEETASLVGSVVIFSIGTVILIFFVKNYKAVLGILGVLIILGLIFGLIGWFFALPATTIIIILLILILMK